MAKSLLYPEPRDHWADTVRVVTVLVKTFRDSVHDGVSSRLNALMSLAACLRSYVMSYSSAETCVVLRDLSKCFRTTSSC